MRPLPFLAAWAILAAAGLAAEPTGIVVELNDCEVYTGNCTASAEAAQGGRISLRVWKIDRGSFRGVDLSGATAALIETADENLPANPEAASRGIAYLPGDRQSPRNQALLAWMREKTLNPHVQLAEVESGSLTFHQDGPRIAIEVGKIAHLKAAAIPHCGTGSCGEQMIYEPRSPHGDFVALLNTESSVDEPRLQLGWQAHGMRSVFLATFGEDASTKTSQR